MKSAVTAALRTVGLLPAAEAALRARAVRRCAAQNRAFAAAHPGFATPPPALLYETASHASIAQYRQTGEAACRALAERAVAARAEHGDAPITDILDWGAGVMRVARWWGEVLPEARVTAVEPERRAVAWAKTALAQIDQIAAPRQPPLPAETGSFDLIYGISILTHLPVAEHPGWIEELTRLARPGGLIALTFHGERAASSLSQSEQARWRSGEPVERARVQRGSRLYATYMPQAFLRERLFAGLQIVQVEPDSPAANGGQDLWLLRKPA